MRKEGMENIFSQLQIEAEAQNIFLEDKIQCKIMENASIYGDLTGEEQQIRNDIKSFKIKLDFSKTDAKMKEYLQNRFGYCYPHRNLQEP